MKENKKEYGMPKTNSDFKTTGKKKKIRGRRDKLQKGSEVENEERMEKAQGKRYPEDPLCYILQ